jgi:mannose-6-phosphate isomerase-like protein (cupin superfamily)
VVASLATVVWPLAPMATGAAIGVVTMLAVRLLQLPRRHRRRRLTIRPSAMRTMHWHPNADEWQYYMKGTGRMTVFNAGPAAVTANFHPGDIGYVKKGLGHYIENTGNTDLVFVAVFRAPRTKRCRSPTGWRILRRKWLPPPSTWHPRLSHSFRRTAQT